MIILQTIRSSEQSIIRDTSNQSQNNEIDIKSKMFNIYISHSDVASIGL
jgi:hypothetical protein